METNYIGTDVESDSGIEAGDLVSLLSRFEEATNPAEEGAHLNKRRSLIKNTSYSIGSPTTLLLTPLRKQEIVISTDSQSSRLTSQKTYSILPKPANCVKNVVSPHQRNVKTNRNKIVIKLNNEQFRDINSNKNLIQKSSTNHEYSSPVVTNGINNSTTILNISEVKTTQEKANICLPTDLLHPDHDYCTNGSRQSKPICDVHFQIDSKSTDKNIHILDITVPLESSAPPNTLEESQVFIDIEGNDILKLSDSSVSCFKNDSNFKEVDNHQLAHQQLAHQNHNKEDNDLFEKIPSYYTTLSIPAKPIKTTVFESASTSVGRVDHIDFVDKGDTVDELQYNKVPAHRMCFTNTAKELDLDTSSYSHRELVSHSNSRSHSPWDSAHLYSSQRLSRSRSRSSSVSSCSTCDSFCSNSSCCSTCNQRSRSRSCSTCSSQNVSLERSRSRSGSLPRRKRKISEQSLHSFHRGKQTRSRSPSNSPKKKAKERERERAMEERRVVYVGKIPNDYTKRQMYQRFKCFGEIKEIKLNFREYGDNYGFVTFAFACDAIAAKERGNNTGDPLKFDLCFGGRRQFCADQYADLDGNQEVEEEYAPMPKKRAGELDFSDLLRQHTMRQHKK